MTILSTMTTSMSIYTTKSVAVHTISHLVLDYLIFITRLVIWTTKINTSQETLHLIFIEVDGAIPGLIFLIILIVAAVLAA